MSSEYYQTPIVYAAKYTDDQERMKSQSGGAFAALSEYILNQHGVVYGCVFDSDFKAVHMRTDNREDRDKMRYSKYVQSDLLETYQSVVEDLINGLTVLFSGTSCQVAGLRKLVQQKNVNSTLLYCIDIVCHGVPSPMIWRDYLEWEKKKAKSEITKVVCRNKQQYGWKSHVTTIDFLNEKKVSSRVFPKIFYGHNALRPSCYQCPYKSIIHPADITIADYWGIDEALPGYKDEKGVSLILVNNDIGKQLLADSSAVLDLHLTDIEKSMQQPLIRPYDVPSTRKVFWKQYHEHDFTWVAKKYGNFGFVSKVKGKIKRGLKRMLVI